MSIKPVTFLAVVLCLSGGAFAAVPTAGAPDPNVVSSFKQTVYQGRGTDSLLTLLQTVGMNPELTVHKAADGTQVGPFITPGVSIGWSYQSSAPMPSGNSYPVPPANFLSGAPANPSARGMVESQAETLSFSMAVASKTLYVALFQYKFDIQTKQWGWQQLSYSVSQLPTPK